MPRALLPIVLVSLALPHAAPAQVACEPQRLVTPPDIPSEKFGGSVATNGRFWFVGDRAARTLCSGSPFSCSTGAVHVYELFDGALVFRQTLVPPDITLGANYGVSVDADGDRLAVGAYKFNWPGGQRGAVFVYEFDGEEWVEASRVEPPAEITTDFGRTVEIHGDDMVVWPSQSRDRIYTYRYEGGDWTPLETLWPETDELNWFYGQSMYMDDQWLFVGAPMDDAIAPSGGSVYVYRRQPDGTTEFVQKLAADSTSRFGRDLDYNGRSLLIGMPGYSPEFEGQGGILAYEYDGQLWELAQQIIHSTARRNHAFGHRVSVDGTAMVASTQLELTHQGKGAAYHFEQNALGHWSEVRQLIPTPTVSTQDYGDALAIHGRHALVTSLDEPIPGADGDGAAYLFDLACNPCPADLDTDGVLTIFDYLAFFNAFDAGNPIADFDGNGEFTIFDFLAFGAAFDAGCE